MQRCRSSILSRTRGPLRSTPIQLNAFSPFQSPWDYDLVPGSLVEPLSISSGLAPAPPSSHQPRQLIWCVFRRCYFPLPSSAVVHHHRFRNRLQSDRIRRLSAIFPRFVAQFCSPCFPMDCKEISGRMESSCLVLIFSECTKFGAFLIYLKIIFIYSFLSWIIFFSFPFFFLLQFLEF